MRSSVENKYNTILDNKIFSFLQHHFDKISGANAKQFFFHNS